MYVKTQKIVLVGKFIATLFFDGKKPVWDEYPSEEMAAKIFTEIHIGFRRDEIASHQATGRAGVIADKFQELIIVRRTVENDFKKLL